MSLVVALVGTACIPRDTSQIVLDREASVSGFGVSWELDFYRNSAYGCGLSGNYTFLVMNPGGHADATAPLLVYLHGGGGYFDDQGDYHAVRDQTEDTWNHEETFDDLWQRHIRDMVLDAQDQPVDNTLKRRIEEGYGVLVVSMCDHDLYSGLGSEYPNNPVGGEVNGLQATMAAVDYTVANYPTTHVFAQGTSAGSAGVFALAASFAHEGTPLTGVVADSTIITPRLVPLNEVFAGMKPPIAEAATAGLGNCSWAYDGLEQTLAVPPAGNQEVVVLSGTGHVPTNSAGTVNDTVDDFIDDILSTNPPPPFDPS